jgi:GNAT superfamily N-acetyltransferase
VVVGFGGWTVALWVGRVAKYLWLHGPFSNEYEPNSTVGADGMSKLDLVSVTRRPIGPQDMDFLADLYASTRADELSIVDWDEEEKAKFLKMQFDAQHAHYQEHYGNADFDIILYDGEPIGRLYLERMKDEYRLIDIALILEYRNKGLGSQLMRELLDKAADEGIPVRIHVEKFNPALRLYERLGFRTLEDKGVYLFMEWEGPVDGRREG